VARASTPQPISLSAYQRSFDDVQQPLLLAELSASSGGRTLSTIGQVIEF
jgi:hypothetical protein